MIPAIRLAREPLLHFRRINQRLQQRLAREEVRLIVAMDFGMQACEPHEQRCTRARMTEDEKFFARKKLFDFVHFLARDGGDGVTAFLFRFAFEQDARGGFDAGKHSHPFQFNMINPAKQIKIPVMLTQLKLSLKTRIAAGTRISDATTLTNTAATPKFQPER